MTLDEAKKVAAVCETADGGCSHCISSLCYYLQEDFPEFVWEYREGGIAVSFSSQPDQKSVANQ
jgi:hypothetical protein